ncbi:hypothetical protein [Oryzomonas sagensis]|uniref:hypothetical protein n=1 Tax=Oryzomonas sagensis TaxID=2603857 RepID=UPI0017810379|nr:hypothetical protein [Oryzomonas sagensis]
MSKVLSKRVTVRFSEQHYDALRAYAEHEGTDPAAIIRHLVARFLNDRCAVLVPSIGGF